MKYLPLALLLSGCVAIDTNSLVVPGVVDRSLQDNIWLSGVDTGKTTSAGITVSDVNVVTYGRDLNALARLRLAQANGASVSAALTQAVLATAISGIAIGHGPVAAAGGIAAASLFLQQVFGIVNTPARANAYQQLLERNLEAENEYFASLAIETCEANVSGSKMTSAGAVYAARLNNSTILFDKAWVHLMPTLEQMQGATPAIREAANRLRARQSPCPQPQASVNRATVP